MSQCTKNAQEEIIPICRLLCINISDAGDDWQEYSLSSSLFILSLQLTQKLGFSMAGENLTRDDYKMYNHVK